MASRGSRVGARLIKGLAVRARDRHACTPEALSVPGEENPMADVASRSFAAESGLVLSDDQLLRHFCDNFPLPQSRSWRIVTLSRDSTLKVVSTLRGERLTVAQWTSRDGSDTGTTGVATPARDGGSRRSSTGARQRSGQASSLPLLSGSGKATTDEVFASLRSQWTGPSVPLARPSSWLDGPTQRKPMAVANASSTCGGSSSRSDARTPRPSPNLPSP